MNNNTKPKEIDDVVKEYHKIRNDIPVMLKFEDKVYPATKYRMLDAANFIYQSVNEIRGSYSTAQILSIISMLDHSINDMEEIIEIIRNPKGKVQESIKFFYRQEQSEIATMLNNLNAAKKYFSDLIYKG